MNKVICKLNVTAANTSFICKYDQHIEHNGSSINLSVLCVEGPYSFCTRKELFFPDYCKFWNDNKIKKIIRIPNSESNRKCVCVHSRTHVHSEGNLNSNVKSSLQYFKHRLGYWILFWTAYFEEMRFQHFGNFLLWF